MSEEERSQQRREQDKDPQGGMLNEWVESPNEKQRKTRILLVVIFTRVHTMNRHSVQVWQGKRGRLPSVPNVTRIEGRSGVAQGGFRKRRTDPQRRATSICVMLSKDSPVSVGAEKQTSKLRDKSNE